jgi:hypothetical protein
VSVETRTRFTPQHEEREIYRQGYKAGTPSWRVLAREQALLAECDALVLAGHAAWVGEGQNEARGATPRDLPFVKSGPRANDARATSEARA